MELATRYFKSTLGVPAEVVIINAWMNDASYPVFQAAGAAGEGGWFWDDKTQLAVAQGEALLPENSERKIFFGWKQGDGTATAASTVYRTTGFPVKGLTGTTLAYNAGTAEAWTLTVTGTVSNGQIISVTVCDRTARAIPYNRWEYSAVVSGGNPNTALASIAAQINAEKIDPIVTASAATNVLTITAKDKRTNFEITSFLETTPAAPTDASILTRANSVKGVAPVGDVPMLQYLETFLKIRRGDPIYVPDGTLPSDWGNFTTNISGAVQYGMGVIRTKKWERGEVRNFHDWGNLYLAVPTATLANITLPITPVP